MVRDLISTQLFLFSIQVLMIDAAQREETEAQHLPLKQLLIRPGILMSVLFVFVAVFNIGFIDVSLAQHLKQQVCP